MGATTTDTMAAGRDQGAADDHGNVAFAIFPQRSQEAAGEQERPPLVLPTELCQLVKIEELADGSAPASEQYRVQMPCRLDKCYDKSALHLDPTCNTYRFFGLRLTSNPGESLATAANCRFQSHSVVSWL